METVLQASPGAPPANPAAAPDAAEESRTIASLIEEAGGATAVADRMSDSYDTVDKWRVRNRVPIHRAADLLDALHQLGVRITADALLRIVNRPPATRNEGAEQGAERNEAS